MLIRHINVNQGQMKVKVELFLTLKELVLKDDCGSFTILRTMRIL